MKDNVECGSGDTYLGSFDSPAECAYACFETKGCKYFIYGKGFWKGEYCWWEKTDNADCIDADGKEQWEKDSYDFYALNLKRKYTHDYFYQKSFARYT